jgi:hypothetical protein
MDRRRFLRLGAGVLGALATPGLLQACRGKGKDNGPTGSSSPTSDSNLPPHAQAVVDARLQAGAKRGLSVFQAGEQYLAGVPTYLAFGLVANGPVFGSTATIWAIPEQADRAAQLGPLEARYYGYVRPDGPPPIPQGVNATEVTFPAPGIWTVIAEVAVNGQKLVGDAAYQVFPKEASKTPYPGQAALPTDTPTVADHKGVNPICTRQPACDMHQVSLASALKSGKPIALAIGTPAFCKSRVCGPNLDELIAVQQEVGSKAVFVHAEVYIDDKAESINGFKFTPAMLQWHLLTEPWLFLIDRKGVVASRFEGPLTAGQIKAALAPLL